MSSTRRLEAIARTQLTSTAATVSLQNIPTDFRKLFLVCYMVPDTTTMQPGIRLNNDSGANYTRQIYGVDGPTAQIRGRRNTSVTEIVFGEYDNMGGEPCFFTATIIKPVAAEVCRMTIQYQYTSTRITPFSLQPALDWQTAEWTNTADLINRIDLFKAVGTGNYRAGTRVLLYGSRD